jgi:hypothetical protein
MAGNVPDGSRRGVPSLWRIESLRVVVASLIDLAERVWQWTSAARRRPVVVLAIAVFAPAAAGAAGQRVGGFHWFAAASPPAGWSHRAAPSDAGILSYPSTFVAGKDRDGVSRERLDRHGTVLVYLDATPKEGTERLRDWPSYRLGIVRRESDDVHEDGQALGLSFRGGTGSCVLDDYRTRVENHRYREIACLVQGRRHTSDLIATALESAWARAAKTLERAVDAYRVT